MNAPRTEKPSSTDYPKIINDEGALALFMSQVKKFNEGFCTGMYDGDDFTVRLEVHGDKHNILHARAYVESIKRPIGKKSKK